MTFYIYQSGFEGAWYRSALDAVRALCELFGLDFAANAEKLLAQVEAIPRGCALKHPDLSLSVERIG